MAEISRHRHTSHGILISLQMMTFLQSSGVFNFNDKTVLLVKTCLGRVHKLNSDLFTKLRVQLEADNEVNWSIRDAKPARLQKVLSHAVKPGVGGWHWSNIRCICGAESKHLNPKKTCYINRT